MGYIVLYFFFLFLDKYGAIFVSNKVLKTARYVADFCSSKCMWCLYLVICDAIKQSESEVLRI